MQPKDYYTIIISVIALIVSIFSNFFQKAKENQRSIRKNLSDTLESVTKINFENSKLRKEGGSEEVEVVEMRRIYNSQRRILVAHADFLILKYDKIVTEIDCNIMAGAYANIGDAQKAEFYWKKTIDKSESGPIKHMNLRGYALFLFRQGKIEVGRSKYKEALLIDLPDNDPTRILTTDTYLMWAAAEKNTNNKSEETKLINDAISTCSRIGNNNSRLQMEKRIKHVTAKIETEQV